MNICIFGASITHGEYDPENGGWSSLLQKHLYASGYDITIYNLGISGNTTEDLLRRIDNETSARKPTIIIVSIGNNDSAVSKKLGGLWVPHEKFASNIQDISNIAHKYTSSVVFTGLAIMDDTKTNPYPEDPDKTYTDKRGLEYSKIIEAVCERNQTTYLPLHDVLSKSDLYDGLHPNTVGHEKIFKAVLPVVEKLISESLAN